jgi:hypothetical protein
MSDLTESDRSEIARLYRIMDIPGSVNVLHIDGKIWLADGFVLLNATGMVTVNDLAPGLYKIQLRNGFVLRDEATFYKPAGWLDKVHRYHWCAVRPTRWAPYPSEAKARLFFVEVPTTQAGKYERYPLALNEEIWRAIVKAFPSARFWHAGYEGPIKVTTEVNPELAYIEPATIPEDLQSEAIALVEAIWQQSS